MVLKSHMGFEPLTFLPWIPCFWWFLMLTPKLYKDQKQGLYFLFAFMVEPLLSGIVLGLVPITIAGLLTTAYLQYRRGDSLNF